MSEQPDLTVPTAVARRALPRFGISPDARLTFIKLRENAVFRVDDGDRAYALRVHRHGHRSPAETACEMRQAIALHEAGVPVSRFVQPIGGDANVNDDEGRAHLVDVQHWLVGSELFDDSVASWMREEGPDPALFRTLGVAIGQLHAASRALGRIPGYQRPAWDLDGLAGATPLWGDPSRLAATTEEADVLRRAVTSIRAELHALGRDADVFGVIHADATPENVLVDEDGHVTLIDFDDFGEGWWLFDLATLLFWYTRHPREPEYREALLGGYRETFAIPDRALAALDVLILARGTTYLGWAADRPGDETSEFLRAEVLPEIVARCRAYLASRDVDASGNVASAGASDPDDAAEDDAALIRRRGATIGPHSPLFYDRPLHFVRGDGVWLTDVHGERYLDAYNNVPAVGHGNDRVADAVSAQLHTLNVHTRYLSEPIVDYAEDLLSTFGDDLDRVYFTNSGSESNELALRIARHQTGASGIIVTDFSYHGNTIALAQLTTGLTVSEPFGAHVRAVHVPDLDELSPGGNGGVQDGSGAAGLLDGALAHVDAAIASLIENGHGVSALLFDTSFSTEGLPRLPEGYLEGLVARVRAVGGLVIADEVQAGLGRLGDAWWGHEAVGISPQLVTLGKPLGNGFPIGGVVTKADILESFSPENMYFNTFAGTPAAAAAGHATLLETRERGLVTRAGELGRHVGERLGELAARHDRVLAAKGRGLFFGLALVDEAGQPDGALAKRIVEALVRERILISRIGPHDSVLKIRPPLVIERAELDRIIDALDAALGADRGH